MTFTPTAIPTDQQETAAILAALTSRHDEYKITFNDNRIKLKTGIVGDRNVIITVLSDNNNKKVNADIGLYILLLCGKSLEPMDLDRVAVDVRTGTKEINQTNVILRFSKADAVEYSYGRINKAEMLSRQEE